MSSMLDKLLYQGYRIAQEITKTHAKTFYFASLFLPKQKRYFAYTVYAICRISDQAVDNVAKPAQKQELSHIQEKINTAYSNSETKDPLVLAFKDTIQKNSIPEEYFDILIEGMRTDMLKNRYNNFKELKEYCYKVAGIVGLIMLRIFGSSAPGADKYAINLGIAMQLTNIIRDIKEDLLRNRIYLPRQEMNRYNLNEVTLKNNITNDNFKALLRFQIERARKYYEKSLPGIALIKDWSCRFVVALMRNIYAAILNEVENNDSNVFERKLFVPSHKKIYILLKTLININCLPF